MTPRRPWPEAAETADEIRSAGAHWAPLLLPGLPTEVPFGVVGRLLTSSGPAEMWMELHRLPRDRALELLDRAGAVAWRSATVTRMRQHGVFDPRGRPRGATHETMEQS